MSDKAYTAEDRAKDLRSEGSLKRLLIEAAVLKKMQDAHKLYKSDVQKTLSTGESIKVKNDQGLELGSVSMTSPSMKAVCSDKSILLATADERGMELVDSLPAPGSDKYQQVVDYLYENAPELLETNVTRDDADQLGKEVLENWQITGELPAGWKTVEASTASIRVTPGRSAPAKAAIDHLVGKMNDILPATPKGLEK